MAEQVVRDRFVTVVGPGGIGKTTVAVAAGHALLQEFAGEVYFFDLGPLNDPLLVSSAVASTLGLSIQSDDPLPGLIAYLSDKRTLLIFDSCEHVIESAAALTERVFLEAPQAHILATSREALRVDGEHVQPLSSLESPPDTPGLSAAAVLSFPAAQLFVERVRASGRPIELADRDAATIGAICRRLDGIALAIELTAGRVSTYGLDETAERLNNRLKLLWAGRRTAIPRHQTLGATLDWSYDLLLSDEQIVLCRLSAFVGVFTLEAARSVAVGADIDDCKAVAALTGLVAKSLVAANTNDVATRYRLLDTTRSYALAKLIESGEADMVSRRHAQYFTQLLNRTDEGPTNRISRKPFAHFGEHLGNVRAALEWSFLERGDRDLKVTLAAAASHLFLDLSLLTECSKWADLAIPMLDERRRGSQLELELQVALGLALMFSKGNSEKTGHAFRRGLALAAKLGDTLSELRVLGRLQIFHGRIGDFRVALEYAKRSAVVAEQIGDAVAIAEAHSALGIAHHLEGNGTEALRHLETATADLSTFSRIAPSRYDFEYRNRAQIALARELWLQGNGPRALAVARETVEQAETFDHPVTLCVALIWAISVVLWNREFDVAQQYVDRFSAQADQHFLAPYQAVGRGLKGELLVRCGDPEQGLLLLREAVQTMHELRYELLTTSFMTAIAEGLAMIGRFNEAARAIDKTISRVTRNGDLFMIPELLRIKGEILSAEDAADPEVSESLFRESCKIARKNDALAWELRAAISLAKFRLKQCRRDQARNVLVEVYDRFADGEGTVDLAAARDLLSVLR